MVVVVCGASCRRDASEARQRIVRQETGSLGRLTRTSQTRHLALREELARLSGENAMPSQLTAVRLELPQDGGPGWRLAGQRIADAENVAAGLAQAFRSADVHRLARELDRYYPAWPTLDDGASRRLEELARRYGHITAACRQALNRPHCELAFQFTEGLTADLSSIDHFLWANRLLGITALVTLAAGDVEHSISDVVKMLRLASHLSQEPLMTARVAAARSRDEAFRIMQVICRRSQVARSELDQLYQAVQQSYQEWPPDSAAWIGERALGLHAYEMVRNGDLLALMHHAELAGYDQKSLATLCRQVEAFIDEDEWFYLTAMRKIVAACSQPYYQRRALIEELQAELTGGHLPEQKRFVAHLLLAKELDWAQRIQARDRALCEAWLLALGTASGNRTPPVTTNPLTGKPYQVVVQNGFVYVLGADVPDKTWQSWPEAIQVYMPQTPKD